MTPTKPITIAFHGIDPDAYHRTLAAGIDHGGNPIETFEDAEGGWPLRCCLQTSSPGQRLAIIAWSPYPWRGRYAETGPIVAHADVRSSAVAVLPVDLEMRPMTLRPYTHDHRIHYDLATHVAAGRGETASVSDSSPMTMSPR